MNDLIDTTEMYLRTIYELEEEGVVPLRARIAERLAQSGPTVSQTVARMERDGLLVVAGDRHLELTDAGRELAIAVMRKHRLAERLLVDVIGLEWEHVHAEACRWEHVMSEAVERKVCRAARRTRRSPRTATRFPGSTSCAAGVTELPTRTPTPDEAGTGPARRVRPRGGGKVEVRRIAEHVQIDEELMAELKTVGLIPGNTVQVQGGPAAAAIIEVHGLGAVAKIDAAVAHAVLVTAR